MQEDVEDGQQWTVEVVRWTPEMDTGEGYSARARIVWLRVSCRVDNRREIVSQEGGPRSLCHHFVR